MTTKVGFFYEIKATRKYLAIKGLHEQCGFSIQWMFISYYTWLNRSILDQEQEDIEISQDIQEYQQRYYTQTPIEVRKEILETKVPTFYLIPINPSIARYNQQLKNLQKKKPS